MSFHLVILCVPSKEACQYISDISTVTDLVSVEAC